MENTTPTPPALPEVSGAKKEKYIISIIIFILAIAVAYLAWYVNGKKQPVPSPEPPVVAPLAVPSAPPAPSPEEKASLGAGIYEQAQNPVKDKIPENVVPVTNPIDGAYKNPFQ